MSTAPRGLETQRPNTFVTTEPVLRGNISRRDHALPGTAQRHALKPARIFGVFFSFRLFPLFKCHISPFLFSAFHPFFRSFFFSASLCLITSPQQTIWKDCIPATRHALRCDSHWDHSGSHSVACTVPDKNSL